MKRFSDSAGIAAAILIVLGLAGPAPAGEQVPFNGRFEGLHVSRTPIAPGEFFDRFEVTGQANQLGAFELVIEAFVDFGTLPPIAEGRMTFTAANGDLLVADFQGSSALVVPGLVLITEHAIVDPDLSTGRFAGATGAFTLERLADAATGVTGVTEGAFKGTISSPGTK
jgi:hypothetical protein